MHVRQRERIGGGWDPNLLSLNPNTVALKHQFERLIVAEKNLLTEIR